MCSEFMSAMNVLCSADTNQTLALAFMLADADQSGYLTPSEFAEFLSAFMRMVLALNSSFATLPPAQLQALVEKNVLPATQVLEEWEERDQRLCNVVVIF